MEERWLSVDEIATHLGISRDTVYKWISRKQMPAHKLGKLWKFRVSEVDAWVKSGRTNDGNAPNNDSGSESKDGGASP
ncbi:MAG: helix-turn-helix domain-containing protein [Planctomycetes bacterium]|nr:helix-turn-helix domain-containing protein [Planctomycetota bacterium]